MILNTEQHWLTLIYLQMGKVSYIYIYIDINSAEFLTINHSFLCHALLLHFYQYFYLKQLPTLFNIAPPFLYNFNESFTPAPPNVVIERERQRQRQRQREMENKRGEYGKNTNNLKIARKLFSIQLRKRSIPLIIMKN